MTTQVLPTAWSHTGYVDGVVQKLQTKGHLLAGTALAPTSIVGNEVKWFTGGEMETEEIDRAEEDAALSNPDRGNLSGNFKDYGAMAFIKGVDINRIFPGEQAQLEKEGAAAIGRRADFIQLDELHRAAEAAEVATLDFSTEDIDPILLQEPEGTIVGIGDSSVQSMFCVLPMFAWQQLCNYKEFNSAEYTGPDLAYTKMAMRKTWGHTNYFVLPNKYFLRAPFSGSIHEATGVFSTFMWWGGAVGAARRDPPADIKVQYSVPKRGTYIDHQIGGIAKVLQPDAMKRLKFRWRKPRRFVETVQSLDITP